MVLLKNWHGLLVRTNCKFVQRYYQQ
jgi:hypothetical protein